MFDAIRNGIVVPMLWCSAGYRQTAEKGGAAETIRAITMSKLFWQALFAFLALPGMVAFVVPLWLVAPGSFVEPLGLIPLTIGNVLLLWCVRDFYVAGRGTLAPWTPPQELVVVGLYRVSRNPMYIAVILVLFGWALGYRSRSLAIYALAIMLAFHLRVVFGEEPWLARKHGEKWSRYKAQVPRWLGLPGRRRDSRIR